MKSGHRGVILALQSLTITALNSLDTRLSGIVCIGRASRSRCPRNSLDVDFPECDPNVRII